MLGHVFNSLYKQFREKLMKVVVILMSESSFLLELLLWHF